MQSIIKKVVWGCLIIIPFVTLYIADGKAIDFVNWGTAGMFFPFISGKNILFRILVEIAFAGWIVLALRDTRYRINIKKSPLTIAFAVFIVILLLADLFGVDPMKSLWSNFERMEGFVGLAHVFLYFFVLSAMLHTLKEWQTMFKAFIFADVFVLLYAFLQLMGASGYVFSTLLPKNFVGWLGEKFPVHMSATRLDATIGNSEYFAVFCLMSAAIATILWIQSSNIKKARFYPILIALNLIGLFYSGTRGTMIGLVFGTLLTLSIIAWKEKGSARKVLAGAIVAIVIVIGSIFAFKNTEFVKSSPTLSRIASISPTDLTAGSRIAIWKISYEAWIERPILGYGQDNFSYIYARKFNPTNMWNLEPWYDRSHDVFFDWLVAGGALGLISYLSLYFVSLWLMWRKGSNMPFIEKAVITGAFSGYFVHNIFVFDNLTSYILFCAFLAYIVVRTGGDKVFESGKSSIDEDQVKLLYAPIIGIALVVSLYYVNYRPFMVNRSLIHAMDVSRLMQTMSFADAVKVQQQSFADAINANTLGSDESREQFLQMGVRLVQVTLPKEMPESERQVSLDATNSFIKAVRDDVTASYPSHKDDVRMLSIYGMFYNGIGDAASAEKVLGQAHTLAPKKQLISFDLTRAYLMDRKYNDAYALSRETYESETRYADSAKWYIISAIYTGRYKDARAQIIRDGQTVPFDQDILSSLISTKQISLAIELLNEIKSQNPQYGPQIDEYIKKLLASPAN